MKFQKIALSLIITSQLSLWAAEGTPGDESETLGRVTSDLSAAASASSMASASSTPDALTRERLTKYAEFAAAMSFFDMDSAHEHLIEAYGLISAQPEECRKTLIEFLEINYKSAKAEYTKRLPKQGEMEVHRRIMDQLMREDSTDDQGRFTGRVGGFED